MNTHTLRKHIRRHALIALPLALAFAAAPALADNGRHHDDRHHEWKEHGWKEHDWKEHGRHDNGRHLGWRKQAWKRGDRIVWVEVEPRYYVDDYRVYHLSPPPPGYRWVRPVDDRYLLVEIATGLIVEALGY